MDLGAISGAANILGTMYANSAAKSIGKTQARTANYIRGLNNKTAEVENERNKVLTGLQRWRQNVFNQRVMEGAAQDVEVMAVNHLRQKDARKRASFGQQIQYAEQEGRMAAQAAFSGVTGSVVAMLDMTMQLKQGMENAQRAETERMVEYDYSRKKDAVWWANMDQLDYSLIFDPKKAEDYGVDVAQSRSLLTGVKTSDLKAVAQGVEFMFKTPADPIGDFYNRGTRGSGD